MCSGIIPQIKQASSLATAVLAMLTGFARMVIGTYFLRSFSPALQGFLEQRIGQTQRFQPVDVLLGLVGFSIKVIAMVVGVNSPLF